MSFLKIYVKEEYSSDTETDECIKGKSEKYLQPETLQETSPSCHVEVKQEPFLDEDECVSHKDAGLFKEEDDVTTETILLQRRVTVPIEYGNLLLYPFY